MNPEINCLINEINDYYDRITGIEEKLMDELECI